MYFWLILFINGAGTTMMHVGNFPTMEACRTAASAATTIYSPPPVAPLRGFVCVQANVEGTTPPPN
jgi:hypothetical protein